MKNIILGLAVASLVSTGAYARDDAGLHSFISSQYSEPVATTQHSSDSPIHKRYFNHVYEKVSSGIGYVKHGLDQGSDYVAANIFDGYNTIRKTINNEDRKESGVKALVTQVAIQEGIPPAALHAVIKIESNFRCSPGGNGGGAAQVLGSTARKMGVYGSLRSCSNSITAGARYLRFMMAKTHGISCSLFTGYNSGRPQGCSSYGRKAMALLRGRRYAAL